MVGIVVVSHSAKIAQGACEMAQQMANPAQKIIAAGGTAGGGIGTDVELIRQAVLAADSGDGVVMLVDLGSAVLSAQTALDLLDDERRARVDIADAPVVEGTVLAAVQASIGADRSGVLTMANSARDMRKL